MPAPSRLNQALDLLAAVAMALSGILLAGLIAIFGWLVYGRYVLNATPTWVEQAALLMVVWITFLGAAVGIRRGSHLSVDFIRDAMPGPLRRSLLVFSALALCAFGAVMAWQGYVMFQRTANRAIPLLGLSEGWRTVPVILSGIMIALFSAVDTLNHLRGTKEPRT